MTNPVVTINGARSALPTLLGQGSVRIPTGGKIRAGINAALTDLASAQEAFKDEVILDPVAAENLATLLLRYATANRTLRAAILRANSRAATTTPRADPSADRASPYRSS